MTRSLPSLLLAIGLTLGIGAMPGCACNHNGGTHGGGPDLAMLGGGNPDLFGFDAGSNACNDNSPGCMTSCLGPTCMPPGMFPLPSDNPPDPNVSADGVGRNPMGWIVLNGGNANFNYIWIADDQDYYAGMISKVDTRTKAGTSGGTINNAYREVARYLTVTCDSNIKSTTDPNWTSHDAYVIGPYGAGGAAAATMHGTCDGTKGCCSMAAAGSRGTVQLYHNRPSRTAVDYNGDAWVANRAHDSFGGGDPADARIEHQSSVSKIANDPSECTDRNGNGKIDTSYDANNDGIIQTDCNANGIPDSLADVAAKPCVAGQMQEFFGLDDECVLFTTNTGPAAVAGDPNGGYGRPLALGPGAIDTAPSDAWAGRYFDGIFYRIDGATGLIKQQVQINPNAAGTHSNPYGAAIDQSGILWAPNIDNQTLFYFDTNTPTNQGSVSPPAANPAVAGAFYGIGLDGYSVTPPGGGAPVLVQQVWLAHWAGAQPGVWRYTPNRAQGFASVGGGTWTLFNFTGTNGGSGRGVGVDNRQPQSYAWLGIDGSAAVGRVPIDFMPNTTVGTLLQVPIAAAAGTTYNVTGRSGTLGTGLAANLDVWAINNGDSTASHFAVDSMGNVGAAPDTVDLDDNAHRPAGAPAHQPPYPYTYSDFTGFGLRNFTNPRGSYSYILPGCGSTGGTAKSKWLKIVWDADVPAGTALTVKARSADDKTTLLAAAFTGNYATSPADLLNAPGPVMPNPSGYLQVEFDLSTTNKSLSPALKSFTVISECQSGIQ